jgi:hypothetical protein
VGQLLDEATYLEVPGVDVGADLRDPLRDRHLDEGDAVGPAPEEDLRGVAGDTGFPGGPSVLARGVAMWATLVGATSLEVFGQYGSDTFTAPEALLEHQLRLSAALLGQP